LQGEQGDSLLFSKHRQYLGSFCFGFLHWSWERKINFAGIMASNGEITVVNINISKMRNLRNIFLSHNTIFRIQIAANSRLRLKILLQIWGKLENRLTILSHLVATTEQIGSILIICNIF
jgi:hypothetical protein